MARLSRLAVWMMALLLVVAGLCVVGFVTAGFWWLLAGLVVVAGALMVAAGLWLIGWLIDDV